MMRLGIEVMTGRFFYVEAEERETVGGLKREIACKEGFEEGRLLLIHSNGRLLKDDQKALVEYCCLDGSIIYLFFLPIGDPHWTELHQNSVTFVLQESV